HLLFHRDADVLGRIDVLDVDASYFDAPFVGGLVQDQPELAIDLVTIRECVVEVHVAHDGTHTGDGQLDDRTDEIGHLVNGLGRFGYLPIDDRVDIYRDVVA